MGTIIGSVVGMLIGIAMTTMAIVQTVRGKLKAGGKALFFGVGLSILVVATGILITHLTSQS